MSSLPITDRTRIRRLPERQRTDRDELFGILDEALVVHVALDRGGQPVLLPMGFGCDDNYIYLHGSTGGGMFRQLANGAPVAIAATHLDGLVFARSLFDSSMNYRSAVIFGVPEVVSDASAKEAALLIVSEHLMPGRWHEVRPMTKRELAATLVVRVSLAEASVKVRAHGASEEPDDGENREVWAGVVPLSVVAAQPERSGLTPVDVAAPASVVRAAASPR